MAHIPSHIFREYDIRGLAEEELTSPVMIAVGKAYGTFLTEKGIRKIPVGGDVRLSSKRIRRDVIEGLRSTGMDVIDIGTVMTPLFYWSLYHFGCDGGVMITGSHNPKEFNGLKLALGKTTIFGEQIQEIRRIAEEGHFFVAERPGVLERADIGEEYVEMLCRKLTLGPKKLKVVLDAGNGTAGLFMEKFFRRLGCDVLPLFAEPDGAFPHHHPDPTVRENLQILTETVLREKADLGIGFDGDADRLGVVDDTGEMLLGDTLMALYWREILPKHPGATAIIEVKSSQALVEEVERLGGVPLFWKSGHSLIKAKMKEIGALFAGEVSGHMFFADEFYGFDDSFYAAARLLRLLSFEERPLSEIVRTIPHYFSTGETRIPCPDDKKFQVVAAVREEALKTHEAIIVDGVRILYPQGWGLLRASNTQPVLVARCEGKTPEALREIGEDMHRRIVLGGGIPFVWTY